MYVYDCIEYTFGGGGDFFSWPYVEILCLLSYAIINILIVVPAPIVSISGLPTRPLYTGTRLQLACLFELTSFVDTTVELDSVWRRGGELITNGSRVNISAVSIIRPSVFQTTVNISPVSDTMDSGQYSCQSVIMSSQFVQFAGASHQIVVTIEGRYIIDDKLQ